MVIFKISWILISFRGGHPPIFFIVRQRPYEFSLKSAICTRTSAFLNGYICDVESSISSHQLRGLFPSMELHNT
jgi:hypothetical protein